MKQFNIRIEEFDIENDNQYETKGKRKTEISVILDDNVGDAALSTVLEIKWSELKNFFVAERKNIPFIKIRSENETK